MSQKNLLVELFVEELPPKALKVLGESFGKTLVSNLMLKHGLVQLISENESEHGYFSCFASPRRLAVYVKNVYAKAENEIEHLKLMPLKVAYDANGQATPALLKKLASLGVSEEILPALRREEDGSLYLDREKEGATLVVGLQQALEEALAKLPIPKVMTYQLADGWSNVQFVRPAHRLIALHGADIVPVSVLGLKAGRTTQGHRFEAKSATLDIRDADSYETQMELEGKVIASFENRRNIIRSRIEKTLVELLLEEGDLSPVEDEALLDEVTGLVEYPSVLVCRFDEEFLEVPQECLILTMKANQKYFPLLDANKKLTNKFLVVSNINPADASAVIQGNERVVRPRLADAKFFFDQDRKKSLADRIPGLSKVVYHNKLGTQGERAQRVAAIARAIGQKLGGEDLARKADEAALLSKADLLTDMVGEFPELQGIMGRYYAQHDKLPDEIAYAIEDHYKPRFSGDELPRSNVGLCVALADKLETLVGMFGIGEKPTGDKDPFALRRHALGVLRMLIEKSLPLGLNGLLDMAYKGFPPGLIGGALADIETFIYERLGGLLREQGYTTNQVEAVLSMRPTEIHLVPKQLEAVRAFAALPEGEALAAANKRVGNILKKAEGGVGSEINPALLQEAAERALYEALNRVVPEADKRFEQGDYTASLKTLAELRKTVDDFFDNVMVNAEDAALRANRLALLKKLHDAMNRIADISKLAA